MRYCTQGHANPDDAVFCGICGQTMPQLPGPGSAPAVATGMPAVPPPPARPTMPVGTVPVGTVPVGTVPVGTVPVGGSAYAPPSGVLLEPARVPATFGQRLVANVLDLFMVIMIGFILAMIVYGLKGTDASGYVGLFAWLLGIPAWYIYFWSKSGRTPGQRAMGVRVVDDEGKPPTVGIAVARFIVASILSTGVTLTLGYLWIIWNPQHRALHDRICGTYVVSGR